MKAGAYETSQRLIGEGDAEANKIYADAYNKDPEFYEFIKALDTYRTTMKNNTKMVIDPDSPLAKFLFGAK
ncbi:Modulator of FtsH protease HflC [compost metagenome]